MTYKKQVKPHYQPLDTRVLELLVCPISKTALILSHDKTALISLAARIAFPIKDGVPLLSIDESYDLSDDEYNRLK